MKKTVFITGYVDLKDAENRKKFYDKKNEFHAKGYNAIIPHEICLNVEDDEQKCMRLRIRKLTECDYIHSMGFSRLEEDVAYDLGIEEID
jgi:hypothetical protein